MEDFKNFNRDYDETNVFYKIITGQMGADIICETPHTLVIRDINPRAKVHLLLLPKGKYTNFYNFLLCSSKPEQEDFWNTFLSVVNNNLNPVALEIKEKTHDAKNLTWNYNFKLEVNNGKLAGQEVLHFHLHLMAN